jgi:glycosyltransferase involved in cell wall biosynthesis
LKIVLALHQFPPFASGGTEQLVRWTALGLRDLGHQAIVVSAVPRRHGGSATVPVGYRDPDGIDVRFLRLRDSPRNTAEGIAREYDDAAAGEEFGSLIDDVKPDVVHFFHLSGLTASALRAVAKRGVPIAITVTDFWFECPTVQLLLQNNALCEGPRVDRMNCVRHLAAIRWTALQPIASVSMIDSTAAAAIELMGRVRRSSGASASLRALQGRSDVIRTAFGLASGVIVPNESMAARVRAFGIAPERVRMLRYGVPAPVEASAGTRNDGDHRPRVAFIGTLTESKGARLLLRALQRVADLDVSVDIFGIADSEANARPLRELARRDPRVTLRGTFDNRDFARTLETVDLLVIPSLWRENSPLVLLQALALRCPVLVADVSGLAPHVRPGRDGWTFRRGDVDDLALQIRRRVLDQAALAAVRADAHVEQTLAPYIEHLARLYGEWTATPRANA